MMNEPVSSIMTKEPITLSPTDTMEDARLILGNHRIHHIPIVEDGLLSGLITIFDLWKIGVGFADYSKIKISKIMTKKIVKIEPDDKIGTAAEIFLGHKIHALPVVNESGQLLGIVTTFDVMKYEFKKEYPNPILFKDLYAGKNQGLLSGRAH